MFCVSVVLSSTSGSVSTQLQDLQLNRRHLMDGLELWMEVWAWDVSWARSVKNISGSIYIPVPNVLKASQRAEHRIWVILAKCQFFFRILGWWCGVGQDFVVNWLTVLNHMRRDF